ncbi:MAG: GspH/FimT family pseudopilin [Hahellaceae bacterium]|nr:GspH/FimT family pseudopilin [Hahellaceae bacterium]MCP5170039.1 GspH/FimT family pseudopilin [Hahellaceae bacterium]
MFRKSIAGMTLPELLSTCTIVGLLIGLAAPSFNKLTESTRSKAALDDLVTFIAYARNIAVTQSTRTTLCPSTNDTDCSSDWNNPLILFSDPDNNRQRSANETLHQILDLTHSTILKASLSGKNYFQYQASGLPGSPKGNIILCPKNLDERYAQQIVINFLGRLRVSSDTNKDGYVENSSGKHLNCS